LDRTVFFAHRMKQRFRIALAVGVAYALMVTTVAAVFPREGKSFVSSFGWWLLAIPVGLVVYAAVELSGTWSLGLPFWQRMPSWARVLLLVAIISCGAVGVAFVTQYLGGIGAV
jgi:hypothetical protein